MFKFNLRFLKLVILSYLIIYNYNNKNNINNYEI